MYRLPRAATLSILVLTLSLLAAMLPSPARADDTGVTLGKEVYTERCQQCHGRRAHMRAMGRSKVLNRVPAAEIVEKLRAYQDGPPDGGSDMKDRMKAGLSDAQIEGLAGYIDTLRR